jgi:hypothetical protein
MIDLDYRAGGIVPILLEIVPGKRPVSTYCCANCGPDYSMICFVGSDQDWERALRRMACGGWPKALKNARRIRSRSAKPASRATTSAE